MKKEYDEKLWDVARAEYDLLNEDSTEYLKQHFYYISHHFGYGLYLRNKYVTDFSIDNDFDRDALGESIFNRIIAIMFPAFNNDLNAIEYVTSRFEDMNIQYHLKTGTYFIDEVNWKGYIKIKPWSWDDPKIAGLSREEAVKKCDEWFGILDGECNAYGKAVYEKLLEKDCFLKKSADLGYSDSESEELLILSENIFDKERIYLPPEILFFKQEHSLNDALILENEYEWIAKNKPEIFDMLPEYIKENRKFAMLSVSANGCSVNYFPKFKNDPDIIKAAVSSSPSSVDYIDKKHITREIAEIAAMNSENVLIFSYDSMKAYRDDDDIVKLAIKANGANIAYTSKRIRDSYDFAKAALENQKEIYPSTAFEALSNRLKHDRSLVLIEAATPYPDLHSFPREFLDDDEIAEIIYNSDSRYMMYVMSKRIRKKYGIDD